MNRILTVLALIAIVFAGFFTAAPVRAEGTPNKKAQTCTKCATSKATAAKATQHSARKTASCCTGGKCPKGCCNTSACKPGAACCK